MLYMVICYVRDKQCPRVLTSETNVGDNDPP